MFDFLDFFLLSIHKYIRSQWRKSFEVEALFGDVSTPCDVQRRANDNIEIVGNGISSKSSETTTASSIGDIIEDDRQIGTPLTAETNQSSRKKVTDTASPI